MRQLWTTLTKIGPPLIVITILLLGLSAMMQAGGQMKKRIETLETILDEKYPEWRDKP